MTANGSVRHHHQKEEVAGGGRWPDKVGILALQLYTPATRVNQAELERYDGVSAGKYTVGLGQANMGFCGDQEDIHSLCLTAVQCLVERNGLSYADIGRLEVGTETIVDKSKSVKSVLMQLFAEGGNTAVEGIDTTNACYGGTAALFNAVSWVESSAWDGRFAVVVAADIAVYASGNARPTGGAGAVAMLVGPHAPLYLERGLRGVHMEHVYDFYKPDLSSEYPVVDGKLSIQCYLRALDHCYQRFCEHYLKCSGGREAFSIAKSDWFAFHSPYTKLVQKSFARLLLNDFLSERSPDTSETGLFAGLSSFIGRKLEDTVFDRDVEKAFMKASEGAFHSKVAPTLVVAREVGNMYTASLYGGIASLLAQRSAEELAGTRLTAFSYGSGLASTLYALRFSPDPADLGRLVANASEVPSMLESRRAVPPAEFEQTLKLRKETHHLAPYQPVGSREALHPGSFFLTEVDDKHRRKYERVPPKPDKAGLPPLSNGHLSVKGGSV